ncbi:MAG: right-handed parallel beta-helix repeat-containing protein [Chthoniobacteraceae bacterium]
MNFEIARLRRTAGVFAAALWLIFAPNGGLAAGPISSADYPSIQEAIAQNPGRRIFIPSGRHELTEALVIKADHTELEGPGTLVQENPRAAILKIRADYVRVRDLTLTRGEKETDDRDGVEATNAAFLRLEGLRIHDNHSAGASISLHDCRFARIERCTIQNYKCIAIDDRTHEPLYGYAFRCINGSGIVVRGGRGTRITDNFVIEDRLLPTREVKERYRLGELADGRQPTKFGDLGREMERTHFARNWHQGSAIVVTSPEDTELTRISGNYLENCAQGIDLHCDRALVTQNTINGGMIGIKAMHGSRQLIIAENMINRVDLWKIMLGPGASSHAAEPRNQEQPARAENWTRLGWRAISSRNLAKGTSIGIGALIPRSRVAMQSGSIAGSSFPTPASRTCWWRETSFRTTRGTAFWSMARSRIRSRATVTPFTSSCPTPAKRMAAIRRTFACSTISSTREAKASRTCHCRLGKRNNPWWERLPSGAPVQPI